MKIGLMSDTHGFLDDAVFSYFANCDEVWHAGDFGTAEVLERLKAFKPVRGVWGNVDGPKLRAGLPGEIEFESGVLRVYMTHIEKDARPRGKPDLFICGHSHIVRVGRDPKNGWVHMNPGAAGHTGWHKMRTLIRFAIE